MEKTTSYIMTLCLVVIAVSTTLSALGGFPILRHHGSETTAPSPTDKLVDSIVRTRTWLDRGLTEPALRALLVDSEVSVRMANLNHTLKPAQAEEMKTYIDRLAAADEAWRSTVDPRGDCGMEPQNNVLVFHDKARCAASLEPLFKRMNAANPPTADALVNYSQITQPAAEAASAAADEAIAKLTAK